MLDKYLKETEIIDFSNEQIQKLSIELSKDCKSDKEIALQTFDDKRISTYAIGVLGLLIIWGGIGSIVVFFIPIPSIDEVFIITQTAIASLFI